MQEILAHPSLAWVGVAIVFLIIEILSPSFGCIFVTCASLVSAAAALFTASIEIQLVVFAASLLYGLFFLRPKFVRRWLASKGVPHRTEQLYHKKGTVTQVAAHAGDLSRGNVDGQDWAVVSDEPIQVGDTFEVFGADGIVLKIRKIEPKRK